MQELIERLKNAAGPNFALEQDIWCAVHAPDAIALDHQFKPPNYTTSIDAALMLVPENHTWWVDSEKVIGDGSVLPPSAYVKAYGADFRICDNSNGATPAIAMCIAALKARAAIRSSEND